MAISLSLPNTQVQLRTTAFAALWPRGSFGPFHDDVVRFLGRVEGLSAGQVEALTCAYTRRPWATVTMQQQRVLLRAAHAAVRRAAPGMQASMVMRASAVVRDLAALIAEGPDVSAHPLAAAFDSWFAIVPAAAARGGRKALSGPSNGEELPDR